MASSSTARQGEKKQASESSEQTVTYTLNPAANLGGYGFADGKQVFAGKKYLATEEEYAERSKARTRKSDGSTVAVVVKV